MKARTPRFTFAENPGSARKRALSVYTRSRPRRSAMAAACGEGEVARGRGACIRGTALVGSREVCARAWFARLCPAPPPGAHGKTLGMRGAVGERSCFSALAAMPDRKAADAFLPKLLAAGEEVRRSLARLVWAQVDLAALYSTACVVFSLVPGSLGVAQRPPRLS